MIRHIVLYKFRDEVDKAAAREKGRELAQAIKSQIPQVMGFACETNMPSASSDNYDIALIVDFDNLAALAEYKQNPAHKTFGSFCHSISDKRSSIDFEL